ncbi:MAG: hypothetical protein ACYDCH_00915, partial [Gaiellaceae bacterium]
AVTFDAPARTGVIGSTRLRDELTATSASAAKGCLAQVHATAPATGRGRRVRVLLNPTRLADPWCAGTCNGKVLAVQTAVCRRGEPCPDIYVATTPGGENFSQPTWTTVPGATSFRTPGLPSHGDAYFVVRARDAAGNEDANTREQKGVDPCV